MKSKAPPKPATLTEEETLRDARVLKAFQNATGGYSVKTIENLSHCNEVQARASINRLIEAGKVEMRDSRGKTILYILKREASD